MRGDGCHGVRSGLVTGLGSGATFDFINKKDCSYNEPTAVKGTPSISTAIPVHEENISMVAGQELLLLVS